MLRSLMALTVLAGAAQAEVPRVVTDIAPVHSLVSIVMGDLGSPQMVVPLGASPHHHAMRPSEAKMLTQADVVIWVGPQLTGWLEGPIANLAGKARVSSLMEVEGIQVLAFREGAMFEGHDHGDHDEEGHQEDAQDDHAEEDHDAHDHEEDHAEEDHAEEEHADHGDHHEGGADPHVWLSPANAQLYLMEIKEILSDLDPDNAATYAQNAKAGQAMIAAVAKEIDTQLADVKRTPFIVLHDGFHYFEAHFDVEAIGSISAGDAQQPGAVRMKTLRTSLRDSGVHCAFSEPGVGTRLLDTATEGLEIKYGVLDPLGSTLELGPDHYAQMLRDISTNMAACLSK